MKGKNPFGAGGKDKGKGGKTMTKGGKSCCGRC